MFPLSHMLKSFVRVGTLRGDRRGGPGARVCRSAGPERHHAAHGSLALPQAVSQSRAACRRSLHGRPHALRGLDAARFPDAVLDQSALARRPIRCRRCCARCRAASSASSRRTRSARRRRTSPTTTTSATTFYKLFLDEGMHYSCAYFLNDEESLEQAQQQQAAADRGQARSQAGPEDPRHRQRLGRARALPRHARGRRRDRRHAVQGAACAVQREGAAARPVRSRALSLDATTAMSAAASTASSRSACSSTSACTTTASSSPRSTR